MLGVVAGAGWLALEAPLCVLLMVVFMLLLPVWLPVVLFEEYRRLRRMRDAAEQFRCEQCGQSLGRRSLELADVEWEQQGIAACRRTGLKLKRARWVHAICAACGARYTYRERDASFVRCSEAEPLAQA